jgi:uncharacterized repeat protein (TIGR03837 family)
MLWDIFCRVIDNHGDIGVCWRLSADLAVRGHQVRLWVDDGSALEWMAPGALEGKWPRIQVLAWEQASVPDTLRPLASADVWIEAFGCEIPAGFVSHFAQSLALEQSTQPSGEAAHPAWINLEYLSAEPYVERCHALPSPVLHGPAKGWIKHFYYPGFTSGTGGLLRDPEMVATPLAAQLPIPVGTQLGLDDSDAFTVSLFCYEPPLLKALLDFWAGGKRPVRMLVTHGRASEAVRSIVGAQTRMGSLQLVYLPLLNQGDFDALLSHCDLNFVRGEDSLVRALWACKPFVWHIYPQEDMAHVPKLQAFMRQMQWSAPVQKLNLAWNGLLDGPEAAASLHVLNGAEFNSWQVQATEARARLVEMSDLLTQLLQFVQKNR